LGFTPPITHLNDTTTGGVVLGGDYFATARHVLTGSEQALDTQGRRFHALTCTHGVTTVHWGTEMLSFSMGQTVLIPASLGVYSLTGEGEILRSYQP
jgi:mannose-6-phosphate isomerase